MALLTPYWGLDGILIFVSLIATAYLFMTRKFKYWSKRGVLEIPPMPFFGNFKECILQKQTPSNFVKELYDGAKGAPYMGFYIFDQPCFLARDPELVKHILVKDFNVFPDRYASPNVTDRLGYANLFMMKNPGWKVLRTKLTPIFTSGKLKKMFELMLDVANNLDGHLKSLELDGKGKEIEVKDLAANFMTDMIGSTAYGLKVNSLEDPNTEFRKYGRKIFDFNVWRGLEFVSIFFVPRIVPLIRAKFFGEDVSNFLRSVFWDTINHRIKSGEKRNDLIDLLIDLRNNYGKDGDLIGFKFDGDDLVAQAIVFFSGGFETSSTLSSFALYELAMHPEIQQRLREEIHEALRETNGKVTYEMVMTLPYLDLVVSETLRKYPPLGFLDRICVSDYKVPNSDVVLKKGTPIFISMTGMHYDPEYFPDPEKFDPERFNDENKRSRPSYTYFPFGEGPHICIGQRLGLLQSKLALIQILRNFEVVPCERTLIPMVLDPRAVTTTALGGLYLNVRKLTTSAG